MSNVVKVGQEWPVWWDTEDGRPAGQHKARILEIRLYAGAYPQHFKYIFKLSSATRRGWAEMTIPITDCSIAKVSE